MDLTKGLDNLDKAIVDSLVKTLKTAAFTVLAAPAAVATTVGPVAANGCGGHGRPACPGTSGDTTVINKPETNTQVWTDIHTTTVDKSKTENTVNGGTNIAGGAEIGDINVGGSPSSSNATVGDVKSSSGGNMMTMKNYGSLNMADINNSNMHAVYADVCTTNKQNVGFGASLGFTDATGKMYGLGFNTGADSETKPSEFCLLLEAAIKLQTNYTNQSIARINAGGQVGSAIVAKPTIGCKESMGVLGVVSGEDVQALASLCPEEVKQVPVAPAPAALPPAAKKPATAPKAPAKPKKPTGCEGDLAKCQEEVTKLTTQLQNFTATTAATVGAKGPTVPATTPTAAQTKPASDVK